MFYTLCEAANQNMTNKIIIHIVIFERYFSINNFFMGMSARLNRFPVRPLSPLKAL